jgi:hypothetical protein
MEKIYHVFISSTYSDLKDERKKVSEAIAKAGYVPEGMELFPASSQKQLDFIKRVIDRCDYYVVIVGGRYGTLADDNVSYTEQEYNYALDCGIPTLAFLHRNPEQLEARNVDIAGASAAKLSAFRERLAASSMVDFWNDPSSLATAVVVAVGQEVNLNPGTGWVRGNQAADPKITEELANARNKISELQRSITTLEGNEIVFPGDLAPIDETFKISLTVEDYGLRENKRFSLRKSSIDVQTSWRNIFLFSATAMNSVRKETDICDFIMTALADQNLARPPDAQTREARSKISSAQLRYQMEALGLIRFTLEEPKEDRNFLSTFRKSVITWSLTEKGRVYLSKSLALKKNKDFI